VVGKMKNLNELYKRYPKTPNEFDAWQVLVRNEIKEVKERFAPNPV